MGLGVGVEIVVGVAAAELEVHVVRVGLERGGALQRLDRLAVLALAVGGFCAEHQRLDVARREPLRLARRDAAFVPALDRGEGARLGEPQRGVIGREAHCARERRDGRRVAAGADLELGKRAQHRDAGVGERGRLGEGVARLRVVVEREVGFREPGPGRALARIEVGGARERDDCFLWPVLLERDPAQHVLAAAFLRRAADQRKRDGARRIELVEAEVDFRGCE